MVMVAIIIDRRRTKSPNCDMLSLLGTVTYAYRPNTILREMEQLWGGRRRSLFGRHVGSTMALVETLVRWSQEWEAVEIVLVIHLGAFGEASRRVARYDQANQHGVDVDLIAVRRRAAAPE